VSDDHPQSLWLGRSIALIGIMLVALSLRVAVAAISPIIDVINQDIPLSSVGIGVIGMLPPIIFALSGFVAPVIAHRLGLERALVLAIALMIIGHLARALSDSYLILIIGSAIALLGMGMGNVLLPPTVKRYFPDRIGIVTASYVTLLSISTAVPALLAAPVAETYGWRTSLGAWSLVATAALIPWLLVLGQQRTARAAAALDPAPEVEVVHAAAVRGLWRSRVAVAITIAFAVSALNAYASFAWLPEILVDLTGMSSVNAGLMLSIFGFAGLPAGIVAPFLVARLKNVGWLVFAGVAFFVIGYLGLIIAPTAATLLWVLLIGLGPVLFPVCLVLINSRTRTHGGSVALSGFAQGIGYTLGALGPLLVGVLHDFTGGWTAPLAFLLATALAAIFSAIALRSPRYVEDELRPAS